MTHAQKLLRRLADNVRTRLANWLAPVLMPDLEERVTATIEDYDFDDVVENTLSKGRMLEEALDNVNFEDAIETAVEEYFRNNDDLGDQVENTVREVLREILLDGLRSRR